ncbi:MAG: hypothetical protein M3137_05180 [Actinomycetota bacterium]|nr:hypothetical protein [Actinomycetota bacterium]
MLRGWRAHRLGSSSLAAPTAAVFLAAVFLFALADSGHIQTIDVQEAIDVAQRLVAHGAVSVTGFPIGGGGGVVGGQGGLFYAPHDIGLTLAFVPVAALHQVGAIGGNTADFLDTLVNPIFAALLVAVYFRFQLLLGVTARLAALATSLLALCTIVFPYAHFSFDATATAFFLLSALLALYAAKRRGGLWRYLLSGGACGAAMLLRVDSIIVVACFAVWLLASQRRERRGAALRRVVLWAVPLLAVAAVTAWYDHVRFGSLVDNGHKSNSATMLTTPLWDGVGGQLFSPGKGIVFFAPLVLVGLVGFRYLARRSLPLTATTVGALVAYVGYHSLVANWSGEIAWGPRFLVPVFTLMMLPLGLVLCEWRRLRLWSRASIVALAIAGLMVQLVGVLTEDVGVASMHPAGLQTRSWHTSQILYGIESLHRVVDGSAPFPAITRTGIIIVNPPVPTLDLWWLGGFPPTFHHPRLAHLVAFALLGCSVACALVVVRQIRRCGRHDREEPSRPADEVVSGRADGLRGRP